MSEKTNTSRRDLLLGLAGVAAVGGGWQAWVHRPRAMTFEPIASLPGWRKTVFEGVTAPSGGLSSGTAFLGIGSGEPTAQSIAPAQLCRTLFRKSDHDTVPVAVFSDFFCPYCRTLTERLAERAAENGSNITINWHELPLLGPSSVIAARAAIAADMQSAYPEFQARLMGSPFRPTPGFLIDTAVSVNLDPAKFVSDIEGQIVASRLARSRGAARTLGIYGTPAMVVGRTLVIGEISEKHLDELLELEAGAPATC